MLEGRKNKKMMAIKWLQSSTVYWFYYISVYPWANKNTRQAIKRIWSEQNVVELLSAAYMHLAAFLPPHTWKRAEGGPRLCPPPPPPTPLSPVKGQWSVPSQRWQMAGEEMAPTCGGGPLHSRRQIRSIIPASLDAAALPWRTRATCASMSLPRFTTTEPNSANKALKVDGEPHVWQRWQIYRRPQIVSGSVSGWQK